MAVTIIATAGAADANSYATIADGTAYHATHLYASAWDAADTSQRAIALVWATRLLDQQIDWHGTKSTEAQALRWPRAGLTDPDGYAVSSSTIPTWLKNATAELARILLIEDRTVDRGYGILSVTADVVSVDFDKSDERPVLPQSVLAMIASYGSASGPGSSPGYLKLQRV